MTDGRKEKCRCGHTTVGDGLTVWKRSSTAENQGYLAMSHLQSSFISARFLLTVGHFTATCVLWNNKDRSIGTALSDPFITLNSESIALANLSLFTAWILCMVCFCIDFIGHLAGFTMFFDKTNKLHILCQFLGGVLVSWILQYSMSYYYLWYVFLICHCPSTATEIISIANALTVNKKEQY